MHEKVPTNVIDAIYTNYMHIIDQISGRSTGHGFKRNTYHSHRFGCMQKLRIRFYISCGLFLHPAESWQELELVPSVNMHFSGIVRTFLKIVSFCISAGESVTYVGSTNRITCLKTRLVPQVSISPQFNVFWMVSSEVWGVHAHSLAVPNTYKGSPVWKLRVFRKTRRSRLWREH